MRGRHLWRFTLLCTTIQKYTVGPHLTLANSRFNKGERETPLEIVETEHQVAQFLKKGVSMITREGRFITMTIMMTAMVMVIS